MFRGFGGCLRSLVLITLVVAAGAVVFHYRGDVGSAWRDLRGGAGQADEAGAQIALAGGAEDKIASLARADGPSRVTLTESEVQSLVEYRIAGFLPGSVTEPRVELRDGRIRAHARVATDRIARLPEAGELAGLLPDTASIVVSGQLIPVDASRVALAVDDITAAKIPLPRRMIPALLERLGRPDQPGVPPDAWALPLPPGATDAFVRGDTLVLLSREGRRTGE